ncbi:MAG: hypothetical protein ACREQF_07750 [Candidatus Binataceae bacterium]
MRRGSSEHSDPAEYLSAVGRKMEIAEYHLKRLIGLLNPCPQATSQGFPPVKVQAHFEGVLFSVKAAVDQITALLAVRLKCPYRRALARASETDPKLKDWMDDPLFTELNELRRLAAHHTYVKRPSGPEEAWAIEAVGSAYDGPRELAAYCSKVTSYGSRLLEIVGASARSR